jgi:hypothetical protein
MTQNLNSEQTSGFEAVVDITILKENIPVEASVYSILASEKNTLLGFEGITEIEVNAN